MAVTEKTAACEKLLEEIASGTKRATEKKKLAEAKGKEIAEQSKVIEVEKVSIENDSIFPDCVEIGWRHWRFRIAKIFRFQYPRIEEQAKVPLTISCVQKLNGRHQGNMQLQNC